MTSQNAEIIAEFLQVFTESIAKTLRQNLDSDIYSSVKCKFDSILPKQEIESLKNNKILYKIDFAMENRQGSLIILIPEDLIANIADSLTGGKGKDAYKGKISEIELNSLSKTFKQVFRDIESNFKLEYEKEFIFSSNPKLVLKEQDEYLIETQNQNFDYALGTTLTLDENQEYKIEIISNVDFIEKLLKDLGFTKTSMAIRKKEPASINLNCLADVKIHITAELGTTRVPIKYALELVRGSLVELDEESNNDIKVYANGVEFAYAQIVAIEDSFGLKITKILSPAERLNIV